jgi:hypothetical protein
MFGALDISTSGLIAQRTWLDTIAGNIANSQTTQRADGKPGPYLRQIALLAPGDGHGGPGVHVQGIIEDMLGNLARSEIPGILTPTKRNCALSKRRFGHRDGQRALVAVRPEANVTYNGSHKINDRFDVEALA